VPIPSSIHIYACLKPPAYQIEEIVDYLKRLLPKVKVEKREEFFSFAEKHGLVADIDFLAKKIACCRVHNVNQEAKELLPLPLEIEYEKKRLRNKKQLKGIIYDGFKLQTAYSNLLKAQEANLSSCHIILTDQLLGTFDQVDRRYHLRVGIYGTPNIISTYGFIEALAKPKEYYLKLQMGFEPLVLEEEFKDQIIDSKSTCFTELLKGYCLQACFYQACGQDFCCDKACRLYNAHWQKEALFAQIQSQPEFCLKHSEIISRWK
jgi:hypothetical protein